MTKKKIKNEKPAYEGYRYIPAAIGLDHYAQISVYVRYNVSKTPNDIMVKQRTELYVWLICPDRELVICFDNHFVDSFNPDLFDECFQFNMLDDTVASSLGINYVMPNFVHDKRNNGANRTQGNPCPNDPNRLTILSDSGGFQYLRGVMDFINPHELGAWYKENVDVGMTLDIPLRFQVGRELITKLAKLQNRNTSLIRETCGDNVEIVNITQGDTEQERRLYREIIEEGHPDLTRLSLGGVGGKTPLRATDTLLSNVNMGKRYSQYHMLGITSSSIFPILVMASEYGDNPAHITSDSSSHKQAALTSKVYSQYPVPGRLRMADIGTKAYPGANASITLNCGCPVCKVIKYRDAMCMLSGQFTTSLISVHNILATNNYVGVLKNVLREGSVTDFIEFVKGTHATHNPNASKELVSSLDLIRRAAEDGYKSARKVYKNQLCDEKLAKNLQALNTNSSGLGLVSKTGELEVSGGTERILKLLKKSTKALKDIEAGKHVATVTAKS